MKTSSPTTNYTSITKTIHNKQTSQHTPTTSSTPSRTLTMITQSSRHTATTILTF